MSRRLGEHKRLGKCTVHHVHFQPMHHGVKTRENRDSSIRKCGISTLCSDVNKHGKAAHEEESLSSPTIAAHSYLLKETRCGDGLDLLGVLLQLILIVQVLNAGGNTVAQL